MVLTGEWVIGILAVRRVHQRLRIRGRSVYFYDKNGFQFYTKERMYFLCFLECANPTLAG